MNAGIYQNVSAINALREALDMTSQNIASSAASGYMQNVIAFKSDGIRQANGPNDPKTFDQIMSSKPTLESKFSTTAGPLVKSGEDTSVAIQDEGFFKIKRPDGKTAYTRNGNFRFNAEGTLVSHRGYPVQGTGGNIQRTEISGNIIINSNGDILQNGQQLAKLEIVKLSNLEKCIQTNDGLMVSGDQTAKESSVENPRVLQGFVEGSNVSTIGEMINLVMISRASEANQKIISQTDRRMGQLIETFST